MSTGTTQLLAFLLVLEGLAGADAHQTRGKTLGTSHLLGVESRRSPFATQSTLTSCDFDDPESPFCDWIQPKDDGAEWLRGEGQKPGESPGPPGGHPERRGSYIYPEARGAVQLQSPDLNPATSEVCVEFLYYLYGLEEEDQLGVNVQDPSGNTTTLWSRRGLQSSAWLLGAVTVQNPVQRPFKVVFSATRVETSEIGLALDTISVRVGPCSPCVAGCNFDTLDDLCQWENPPEGDTQWEQWVGSGDQPGVGPEDDFSRPGFGAYMLLDSLAPESSGAALLKSPRYHSPGGCLSLSFHYTLHGVSNDTALKVYAAPPGAEAGSPLLSFHGEHGPRWNPGAVNYTGTAEIQFVIEGIYRGKPGLAIDSVRISPCEEIFAQCDFNNNEDPFCGWVQPEDNDASWTRTNQTTPTEETGPPGDYPHGEGYYIYAEGGSLKPGQSMRLSSRAFCTDTDACVEFYYYMFGIVEVQTQLRVLMEGPSGAAILLWTRTGVQSPEWLLGSVSVPYGGPQPSKVIFETVRGSNPYLDVALDNISVRRGPCTATGAPTPPPIPEATASPGGPTAPAPSPQATTSHSRPTTTSTVPWPAATSSTAGRPTAGSQGPSASPGPVAPSSSRPATTTQKSPTAASAGSSTTTRGHVSSTTTTTTTTTAAPAASSPTPSSSAQSTRHPTPAPIRTSTVGTAASHATSTVTVGHSSESPSRATTGHATSTINLIGSPTTPSSHATPSSSQAAPTSHPRTSATRPHTETSHVHSSPSPSGPRPSTTVHRTTTSQAGPSTTAASHITPGYSKPSLSSPTTASPTHPLSSSSSTGLPATPGHTSHASSPLTSGHPGSSQSTTGQAGPSVTSPATGHSSSGHTSPSTAGTSAPGLTSGSTSTSPASPSRATSPSPQISTTPIHAHPSTTGPHTEPSHIHSSPSPGGPSPSTTVHRTTSPAGPRTTVAGQNVTLLTTSGHSKPSPSSPTTASPTRPLSSSSSTGLPATPGHTSHASSPLTSGHPDSSQSTTGQAGPPATSPATGHSSWATGSSGHTSPSTAGTSAPGLASGSTSTSPASPSRATSPSPQISTTPIHAHPSTTGPHTEPSHVHSSSSPVGPSPSTTVHRTTSPASPSTTVAGQNVTLLTTPGHSKPSPSSPTTAGHASPSAGSTPGHGNPQPTSSAPSSPSSSSRQPSSSTTGQTSPTTADHVHASTATPKPTTTPSGESPTATRAPPAASPTVPGGTTPHARPTTPATHPTVPGQTTWPASTRRSSTPAPLHPSTPATKPTSVPETSRGPTATRETPALPLARETCTISGDPHYTTYDGRLFHFMGTCTYLLSAVCNATTGLPAFRVEATNEHRGANYKVSYVKSVSVEVYGARIVLLKGRRVTLDGKRVSLPASVADGRVLVRLSGTFVLVQADFGLWVRFDGNHHAEVSAPSPYSGQLCGLCGNYNGQVSDDNLMPNGTSAGTDADRLGESWQVPDAGDAGCTNTGDPGECDKDIAAEAQKPTSCGILTDPQGPFAPCHSRVPPEGPFRSCVYDLCGTGGDAGSLCFALQSYADRCAQAGIPIAWRNSSFCPLNCPPGSSYTPCGPACPATCTDPATSQNSCSGVPCVEGCVCDEGYLLSGDQCVPVDQCGCTDASGQYHPVGERWMGNGDCTQRCLCASRGNISCEEWSCSPVQECRPAEGLLGCQDAARETCTISGDPHYTTYDGRLFHFMGTCTYLLSAVCNATTGLPAFRVEATNEHRGANYKVSYVKSVSVEVYGARIVLLKGRRVTLDGKRVSLPASVADGRVLVRLSGTFVLVQADFGLWVRFDGNHHAEVSAPSPYSGQLCGLCGNYNGQVSDDNLMPNGTSAGTDADRLGESWQVPDAGDAGCTNTGDPGECDKDIAAEAQKPTSCGILTDPQGPFAPCHSRVPPEGPFRSCVYDLCGTGGDAGSLCFALQSYADRCAQAGIPIAWRNSSFCPLNCPPGSSYTPCGPACPATCTDPATSQNSCSGVPCVEGCVCDEGYLLSGDQCVPVDQCGCTDASGQYHPVGESWMGNGDCTQRCLCASRGNISCEEWSCSPVQECRPAEGLLGCQDAARETCTISGDPHYTTYDGRLFHFMGTCTYLLSAVCNATTGLPAFRVEATNEHRGANYKVSYVKSVSVEVYGARIVLLKGRRVTLDGKRVSLPASVADGRVLVRLSGTFVLVQADFGLWVRFDGNHHAEVSAPSPYSGQLCGLCGNYNGQVSDDNLMPNGTSAGTDADRLGESWQVPDAGDAGCTNTGDPGECDKDIAAEAQKPTSCGILTDPQGPFAPCHSRVPPEGPFRSCVYDLCGTGGDAGSLCFALQSYADRCAQAGIPIAWRNSSFCPLNCPPGSSYTPCGPACPATCTDPATSQNSCSGVPCVEGCVCDEGYLLSGDQCVPVEQCGCTDASGQYHPVGESWMGNGDCTQRCLCASRGNISCEEWSCSPVQECRPAEGLLGCQDAARETCTISGDPHYTTYDGRLFHFMGTCTYLLSAVCNATTGLPAFRVEATNEHRGANYKVSYVKSVSVEVYGARIVLLKGRRVTLDGKRVSLPASVADRRVLVRLSGTFVLVQADFGLWVRFDGNHHAEVSAPSPYSGQLCGLCGNYNGQVSDDNLMPNGTSAGTDADRLGESWQVPDAGDAGCTNTGDPGECDKDIAAEAQKPTSCGILTDPQGPFAPCHSRVPPEGPFRSCVYDLCGTGGDAGSLCFALQSYADRCAQAGIPIAWRNSSFCPLNCPPGSSYTPCGPACPATCTDPATSQNSCSGVPCVEGCVCDEGYLLSGDQCVPVEQCGCTDASGQYHPVGESWMGNGDCTQRCLCASRGNISCEEWSCSPVQECRPAEGLLGCQDAGVAACHVAGDPHYYTFDGAMVSFMGTCTYTLVMVCHGDPRLPSFNITAKNEERGQPEASYLRSVTVEVAGATVTLQKSRRVLIDGLRVRTPVEGQIPGVSITTSGIYVVLETDFGLVVKFDGNHHLEIQLPGTYFGKVCGMCGNFNNQSQDELLMPNGHLASNASQFGNSWKAPGDADPGCQPDDREDLQPRCTPQEMERLRPSCREILGPKYQACHSVIDPQPFLKNCLFDLCEYQGMASVLCDNLQSYVEACKSQGVAGLSWRNSTFCPLPCQPHSRYSECTSPCPATCANLYAPASCLRPTACVEGCACDRGYVLSDDSCVSMRDCGCLDNHQEYHSPGDSWVTAGCLQRCSCLDNGKITCQPLQCLPGSHCALSATGERYCRPAKFHRCVVSGDPHYRTFDAFVHHFQGRATYTLTRTLGGLPGALEALSVAGRNRRRFPLQRVSFLREVYVSVYGYRVTLMQGRKLAVNGVKVTPPFYPRDGLQITQRGRSLLLQTDFGFSVSFDGKDFAEIVLPSTYQDRVGGLCGNYDGQRNNEYMKPDGTWTRNLNTFGNSWQVSSQRTAPGLEAGSHSRARREEPEEEVESGFEVDCSPEQLAHVNGTEVCGVLSDPQGPFAACHGVVPPSSSQENCVYDLCALFNDTELLCQEYEAYAWACQEDGVALGLWRQKTGCEMSCPAHTTYKPCMTACPASCANMAAQSDCEAPCVEGCASDPGYILSGLDSVPYNQCGCSHSDQYYQINDTFLTEDCSQRCTCRNTEMLVCQKAGCSDGELCAVANYTRGCFKEGPCLSNPCQNEGLCEETSGSFQCLCPEGYVGPLCEETPFDVLPSPTSLPSASATSPPSTSATPPTSGKTEHLTVILLGVLLPLGLILIVVAVVCICQRRNKKKTEEDHLDILSAAEAPDASGKRVTRF